MNMKTVRRTLLLLAALLCAPAAPRAEFVSIPTVLTVHGLDFSKLSCDPGSVQNAAHNEACYAAAKIFGLMGGGEMDDSYLDYHITRLAAGGRAQVFPFRWGGDIKDSRRSVERLKGEILALHREARAKGAPFIIVAHSWGTVLAAEALAEMEGDGTAGDLKVDNLVTLGSPLGGTAYTLAINGLIGGQNFFSSPRRAKLVAKWDNYYAARDPISAKLALADRNVRVDAAAKYSDAEREVAAMVVATSYGAPGAEALADQENFSTARATELWHCAYFTDHSLWLASLGRSLEIDAASEHSPGYFSW